MHTDAVSVTVEVTKYHCILFERDSFPCQNGYSKSIQNFTVKDYRLA